MIELIDTIDIIDNIEGYGTEEFDWGAAGVWV